MRDHRYPPNDPRHLGRADNAGFSLVITLTGCLALGVMAWAATSGDAPRSRLAQTAVDVPSTPR